MIFTDDKPKNHKKGEGVMTELSQRMMEDLQPAGYSPKIMVNYFDILQVIMTT